MPELLDGSWHHIVVSINAWETFNDNSGRSTTRARVTYFVDGATVAVQLVCPEYALDDTAGDAPEPEKEGDDHRGGGAPRRRRAQLRRHEAR